MNRLFKTLIGTSAIMAACGGFLSSAQAQPRCADVLLASEQAPTVGPGSDEPAPPAPAEIYYTSGGNQRVLSDGVIYQETGGRWAAIGKGRYANNLVYEDYVIQPAYVAPKQSSIPDLAPIKNYQYEVSRFEADRYYPNLDGNYPSVVHKIQVSTGHKFEIVTPKNVGYENAIQGIIRTILELPTSRLEALSTVRFNSRDYKNDAYWQQKYSNFTRAAGSAGGKAIDIYANSVANFMRADAVALSLTRHEFGHLIAEQVFGSATPNKQYVDAAGKDRFAVSEYGKSSWAEDFAEGIEVYLRTNAGLLNARVRADLVKRFSFFDDVFNYRSPQSVSYVVPSRKRIKIIVKMVSENQILAISPELNVGLLLKIN